MKKIGLAVFGIAYVGVERFHIFIDKWSQIGAMAWNAAKEDLKRNGSEQKI